MTDYWKTVTNRWQDSVNLLLGVWLFLSPWALQFTANASAFWNALVLGVVIGAAALAALIQFREWEEWAGIAFGAWLVISPWALGFGTLQRGDVPDAFVATWNFVVVGLLTVGLAAWSLMAKRQHGTRAV